MEEIWKAIDEYPQYKVSSIGRVKSLERKVWNGKGYRIIRERILKPKKNLGGYLQVCLCKEGKKKNISIHRLVCEAFIPNPENLPEVNHKDECKTNNNVNNLEWCTREQNTNYGTRNVRIAKAQINNPKHSKKVKCLETGVVYPSIREVERKLGITNVHITSCCKGKRKTCGGLHWRYVD